MRLLILTQYFAPETGAPQTRLRAFARELIRMGHTVEVVTALPNYPAGHIFPGYRRRFYIREDREGVAVHRVWVYPSLGRGFKRVLNYASFTITCLLGLLKASRPDYIFVESPPLFLALPAFFASRFWRAPLILNVADLWPDSIRELDVLREGLILRAAGAFESWAYRKADFINAVTEGISKALVQEKRVPARKVLLFTNGVDTDLFRPARPDRSLIEKLGLQNKKIVLYQGTLGRAHALENVMQAAKLLLDETDIQFIFLGNGSERAELIRLAMEMSLENTSFIDFVSVEEVPAFLSIAFCGLVSLRGLALFEGSRPAKLFPIMASGKPVVFCGAEGEATGILREAGAGIIVPPDDPDALANAIRAIADDPTYGRQLGANGRRYAQRRFTWSRLVNDWLADLRESQTRPRAIAK